MRVKVLREFRDGSDFSKLYNVGDEVEITDKARLDRLVTLKLIEVVVADKPPKGGIVKKTAKESAVDLEPNTEE